MRSTAFSNSLFSLVLKTIVLIKKNPPYHGKLLDTLLSTIARIYILSKSHIHSNGNKLRINPFSIGYEELIMKRMALIGLHPQHRLAQAKKEVFENCFFLKM